MSTDLSDLLFPDLVVVGVTASSKKSLFQQIGALAAPVLGQEASAIAAALAEREKLGSTGFGGGVAIPHARLPALTRIVVIVARLTQPFDYQSVDDGPVDIVVAMLSPSGAGAEHLKALARVSRRFRDSGFVAKLRGAGSRDAFYALLTSGDDGSARDAA